MKEFIYKKYRDKGKELYSLNGNSNLKKHVKKVTMISEYLCELLNIKEDLSEIIKLGAYLHDIGKTKIVICSLCSAKEHNKLGAKYMDVFLEDDVSDEEKKILKKIIRHHVGKMPKKANYKNVELVTAVTIVRTADKFAANFKDVGNLKTDINKLRTGK